MKKFLILFAIVLSVFAVSAQTNSLSLPATNAPVVTSVVPATQSVSPVSFSNGPLTISLPKISAVDYGIMALLLNTLCQGINNYYLKKKPLAQVGPIGRLIAHIAVDPLPSTPVVK